MLNRIGRLVRYMVLAALFSAALLTLGLASYTSTGRPNRIELNTDPQADDYNPGFYAYGARVQFTNWEYPFGALWHGRFKMDLWYKISTDASESYWGHSLGVVWVSYSSSRIYGSGCLTSERVHADGSRSAEVGLALPSWLPGPVLGAYPFWVFLRGPVRRSRRRARGQCIRCGYDLTGNVTGGCPECGTPILTSAASC